MDNTTIKDLEKRLWDTADDLRANTGLKSSEYSTPILDTYLPKSYDKDIFNTKLDILFNHIIEESITWSHSYVN